MLVPILAIVMAPMQTRMIHAITIPRFENVDLSIVRPSERLRWQEPESGPYTGCAGSAQGCGEGAALAVELLVGYEACAGVFVFRRGITYCPHHELIVGCEKTVARIGGVVLRLSITPTVSAGFLLEDGGNRSLRMEGGLPVRTCGR